MIKIPFHPMIFETDIIGLSWHGFFSVIGVIAAIYMVIKQSRKDGIEDDVIFNVASWGVIGGIIGARLVHIADHIDYYIDNPTNFLYIWRGGIGLWGGILGGLFAGVAYAKYLQLDNGDVVYQCIDWSDKMDYIDHLKVALNSSYFVYWLHNKEYK